jgi:hypothetical protein
MSQFDTTARLRARSKLHTTAFGRAVTRWRGYLARHWRGELALPYASVINGFLLGALLLGAVSALGWWVQNVLEPSLVAVGLTAVWVAVALVTLWQVVGVWRAADRHARAGRGVVAPKIAFVAVLLGVLVSVGVFFRAGLPQIVEASQFALGKDPIGEVVISVVHDGTEIELDGPIVFGLTKRMKQALDNHPNVHALRLSSPGGRVAEARKLRDLIRERGMTTVAAGNCASACVITFMAGRDRLLAPGGSIGFHRYRSPGLDDTEIEASMAIDRRDMTSHGVPDWFLERAYTTPHSSMWRPALAELKVANVVTGELAADGRIPARNDRGTIEAQVLKSPLYIVLKEHEPAVYEQVLDAMEQGAQHGMSLLEVGARTRPLINRLAAKYVPAASDDAILEATNVAAETMRTLNAKSADACYRYIQPSSGPADLTHVPFHLRERDLATTAAIIASGAGGTARPRGESIDSDLQWVFGRLVARFGDDASILDRLGAPGVNPATACTVVTALYEGALSLPAPRSAQLLRFLLGGT